MKQIQKNKKEKTSVRVHLFFIVVSVICLIPFVIVLSASISNDLDLLNYGYGIFPRKVDFKSYKLLFESPKTIIDAYKVTMFVTIIATILAMTVNSMSAFVLSRKSGTMMGKALTYYIYFPTLFGGGLVPSYIINTQYLHLTNKLAVLILPGLVAAFNIFMIRTFIQQQPLSLIEAAKIDGASEFNVFIKVVIPLAKPVLATVAFNTALANWNTWYNSMIYIRDPEKVTLQHLLQRMLLSYQAVVTQIQMGVGGVYMKDIPGESLRMAMLVVAIGPMMMLFPFFQKYFVKGMVVGAVKG